MREGRRRRDGQLPSPRRLRALRSPGPDGAAVLASLSAGRRFGKFRLARRRQRRGDALHRVPAHPNQRRDAQRNRAGDGPVPAELRRHQDRTGRAAGPDSESPDQRHHRHRRRHGHQHSAAQPRRDLHGADQAARQRRTEHRAVVPLGERTRLPHRRSDSQLAGGTEGDLQNRLGLDPAAWHLGHRTRDTVDQDDLRRERALHGEQVAADRAHRRDRDRPQAAATARRQGSVDRRCADCDRDEEGRRREDDHGVSLQAHTAADQLRGQPHLPDPDRKPRGRPARTTGSEADPVALPALPARSGDAAPRTRTGGAQETHPPARGLRDGVRRARRDHQDHPQVGRQGRLGGKDHGAVQARRRADRRDPRAEDLPPGAARDPDYPQGAGREACARPADQHAAERRGQPLEAGARRSSRRSRPSTPTSAAPPSPAIPPSPNTPPTTSSSRKTTS